MKKRTKFAITALSFFAAVSVYTALQNGAMLGALNQQDDESEQVIRVDGLIPAKTRTELVGEAEVILKGKVQNLLPSRWTNPNGERGKDVRNIIQTDVMIQVEEVFKGTPYNDREVAVRIDKGQVGNVVMKSDGFPDFTEREEVVLFLVKDDGDLENLDEQYYRLVGMRQGKFKLQDAREKVYKNDKEQISLSVWKQELRDEMEKFKTLPKPADPSLHRP